MSAASSEIQQFSKQELHSNKVVEILSILPAELRNSIDQKAWDILTIEQKVELLKQYGIWNKYIDLLRNAIEKPSSDSEQVVQVENVNTDVHRGEVALGELSAGSELLKRKHLEIEKIEKEHNAIIPEAKEEKRQKDVEQASSANIKTNASAQQMFTGYNAIDNCMNDPKKCDQIVRKGSPDDASTWLALLMKKWFEMVRL